MRRRRRRPAAPGGDPADWTDEVDDEIRFHLESRVERLMAEGWGEREARAEALRRFGNLERVKAAMTQEKLNGHRRRRLWDGLRFDLRFALRQLSHNRMLTAIVVLTLALGVGATTSIFSVVQGILLQPLPYPQPDRLAAVWADWTKRGGPANEWLNFPNYQDLEERSTTLDAVAAWDGGQLTLTGHGEPVLLTAGAITYDMFSQVLRVRPEQGRDFLPEEDHPGAELAVLISDALWRNQLGADPSVLGTKLVLDDESATVVGIMPRGFKPPFFENADLWTPLRWDATRNGCPLGNACLHAIARLADGVTFEQAREEARRIAAQLEDEHPKANKEVGFTLSPLRADMVADARLALLVLLGAVGLVLLIACVNVANLLLARATARASELSIRHALGADRARLFRQLLSESALLALFGGLGGIALAYLGTNLLVSMAPPITPRLANVAVNAPVLLFAVAATASAGLLFGVVPALLTASSAQNEGLREAGRGGLRGAAGARTRSVLVGAQIALALILLVGAGLLLRSFQNLRVRDLGFRPQGVLALQLSLPNTRYQDAATMRAFKTDLEQRVAALPGVLSVGTTSWLPLTAGGGSDVTFNVEGRPPARPGEEHAVWYRRVTPGYKNAMGMRLLAGRWLDTSDNQDSPRVVVINDGLAQRFFPGSDPVGQRLNLGNPAEPHWREIVGVVAEMRHFAIDDDSRDALYLPFDQAPSRGIYLAVRTSRELEALEGELRHAVGELDPALAIARIVPVQSLVQDALGPQRFTTLLLSLFAGLALVLAVVGLYGVVSYGVGLRQRELGVRIALGARARQIRSLVLRGSLKLAALGMVAGIAASLALWRLLSSLLFGVSSTDPSVYLLVAVGLGGVAIGSSALPARRASKVDPVEVLRGD